MKLKKRHTLSLLGITISILLILGLTDSLDPKLLEIKYANEASQFINIQQNRVHYRDEGTGPVVLLLHGTASSLHTWDEWSSHLKQNYRVIRMDLPGFGLTGPDQQDKYEVVDDIAFINDFVDALNIESFHLVGWSLGGRIAWQYAIENPDRATSITLVNAVGYPQESWPLPIQLGQIPIIDKIVANFQPKLLIKNALLDIYFDPAIVTEKLVSRYHDLARYPGNLKAFTKRVKASLDEDHTKISSVTQPSLILWGEKDTYFPLAAGKRFAHDIKNSTLISYPNVGHLPMEEVAEQSVQDFEQFIEQLSQSSK